VCIFEKWKLKEKGTTFKFEERPQGLRIGFVGIIPLDRRFNQYGNPKMIML
jgi:hypothetical protein